MRLQMVSTQVTQSDIRRLVSVDTYRFSYKHPF